MRLSPCGFASRDFPRFARLLLLRMISVLRSAVFLYSAPPSVVPIAARPIVPADSAPPAFQVPCTAPFHRQSLCPSRLFQTQDITVPAENAFKYRLGFQQFQPRGKSGIPPPPWRRQRDMRHAQLSFHCSTAHSGIQEDFSFSVCRPLHIIPLRGPPFFWDGGFSGSVKDSGMQKKNQPSQTGSLFVKFTGFQCTIVPQRKEVCKTGFPILPAKGSLPGGQPEIFSAQCREGRK